MRTEWTDKMAIRAEMPRIDDVAETKRGGLAGWLRNFVPLRRQLEILACARGVLPVNGALPSPSLYFGLSFGRNRIDVLSFFY
jgi:hypothetical protein